MTLAGRKRPEDEVAAMERLMEQIAGRLLEGEVCWSEYNAATLLVRYNLEQVTGQAVTNRMAQDKPLS